MVYNFATSGRQRRVHFASQQELSHLNLNLHHSLRSFNVSIYMRPPQEQINELKGRNARSLQILASLLKPPIGNINSYSAAFWHSPTFANTLSLIQSHMLM